MRTRLLALAAALPLLAGAPAAVAAAGLLPDHDLGLQPVGYAKPRGHGTGAS